ncbi:uncharacterized protein BJ171DRAFT_502117 [Polychytrium aggregatum]|uniref:uncharacterized protein n=1 Tax=Polychytrium aggregatum TaxID=110093 RepID=UPI0022FDD4F4|nr:uncharacterized protein BJ171DRAFT_502117 [Polychytrium aggregatum]KAI9205444.1 hypothetical protein BJ171DRAFT_502117 [Polychytrium aggregatum]
MQRSATRSQKRPPEPPSQKQSTSASPRRLSTIQSSSFKSSPSYSVRDTSISQPQPKREWVLDPALVTQTGLSSQELTELAEIFALVDRDHGGTISLDELAQLMTIVGLQASKSELETIISDINLKAEAEIDFLSFVQAVSRKLETSIRLDDLLKAFRQFIPDGYDGTTDVCLNQDIVISILTEYGDPDKRLSTVDAAELIEQVAPSGMSGPFDYIQFIHMYFEGI